MTTNLEIGATVKTEEFVAGMRKIASAINVIDDAFKRTELASRKAGREVEKVRKETDSGLAAFGRIGKEAVKYFERTLSLAAISALIQQMNQMLDRLSQGEQQRLRKREEVFQARGGPEFAREAGQRVTELKGRTRGGEGRLIGILGTLSEQLPESEYNKQIIDLLGPLSRATEGMSQSDAEQAATIAASLKRASGGALTPEQAAAIGTTLRRRVGAGATQITSARAGKNIISAAARVGGEAGGTEEALQFAALMESAASSRSPGAIGELLTALVDRPSEEIKVPGAQGLTAPRHPRLAALAKERGAMGAIHEILTNPELFQMALEFVPPDARDQLLIAREKYPAALEQYRAIAKRPERVEQETKQITGAVAPEVDELERSRARQEKTRREAARTALKREQDVERIREFFSGLGIGPTGEFLGSFFATLHKITTTPYDVVFPKGSRDTFYQMFFESFGHIFSGSPENRVPVNVLQERTLERRLEEEMERRYADRPTMQQLTFHIKTNPSDIVSCELP